MTSLSPMERELLRTVDRMQVEATERERRLSERIEGLTTHLEQVTQRLDALATVCSELEKLLAQG